jgi:choline dehydrogenase-like flavoprotein
MDTLADLSSKPIVVIGAGTAGATVVSCLATHCTRKIVLLEPGGVSRADDVSQFFSVLHESELLRTTPATQVHDGALMPYTEAQAHGGGSAINGLLLTGNEPDMVAGLTRYAQPSEMGDVSRALLASGGRASLLWWNRGRWNPGRILGYLHRGDRITLQSEEALSITMVGNQAVGVVTSNGYIETDHVVVCAGAIQTPALLLRSGLGALNNKIGNGLQNHPTVSFTVKRLSTDVGTFDSTVIKEFNVENHLAVVIAYERAHAHSSVDALLTVSLLDPLSRGAVTLENNTPVVEFNMLSEPTDVVAIRMAVRELCRVVQAPELIAVLTAEDIDDAGTSSLALLSMTDNEIDTWIRKNLTFVSHASSSCAEAVDPTTGALHGVGNITVVDASVLPSVPPCTPAAPVTMEARRIAELLGEQLS